MCMFKLRKRSREQCEKSLFLWRKFAVHVLMYKKKESDPYNQRRRMR